MKKLASTSALAFIIGIFLFNISCNKYNINKSEPLSVKDSIQWQLTDANGRLEISFTRGKAFNHPSFAVWLETTNGNYITTLFVTQAVASGVFGHAQLSDSTWSNKPGAAYRPAALPYWVHRKGALNNGQLVPKADNAYTDATTGATPNNSFVLWGALPKNLPGQFMVMLEINQTWDWNNYWHNNRFPGNKDYLSSAQPSLVYAVRIDKSNLQNVYYLNPIGHGHYDGSDGELYTDISGFTTARNIAASIKLVVQP